MQKLPIKATTQSVASVDENGKVTATGVGVALIFANVTVNGKTVSNSYPLKVMPDLSLKSITVDGKNIEGFNKEVKAYSYLLKSNSKIPVVKASAMVSDIMVDITQAKGMPGTAVIKFIDNITLEKNTYYLNFDVQSVSDEFNSASVGKQWGWVRENRQPIVFQRIQVPLLLPAKQEMYLKPVTMLRIFFCRVQTTIGQLIQNWSVQEFHPNLKMQEFWLTKMMIIL